MLVLDEFLYQFCFSYATTAVNDDALEIVRLIRIVEGFQLFLAIDKLPDHDYYNRDPDIKFNGNLELGSETIRSDLH